MQIIYAARSKSFFNVELAKVEEIGPVNIARAFMVRTRAQTLHAFHGGPA